MWGVKRFGSLSLAVGFVVVALAAATIALGVYANDFANKNRDLEVQGRTLLSERDRYAEALADEIRVLNETKAERDRYAEALADETRILNETKAERDRYAEALADETRILNETKAERDRYAEALADETRILNETKAERDRYAEALADETRVLNEIKAEHLALTDRYGQAQGTIALLEDARDVLTAELSGVNAQLKDSRATVANLEGKVDEKGRQVVILSEQLDIWRERTADAKRDLKTLEAEVGTLASVTAEVQQLDLEKASLNTEVMDLQEERRILIFTKPVHVSSLACTGSMEPTLTCLDEITEVKSFDTSDIVVDTVVSFSPPAECGFSPGARSILHRVVSVKKDDDNSLYQTQGDNNYAPDPCWIPFDNITGAVTVVHKNVNSQNAEMRDSVNAAASGYDAARTSYYREYTRACGFSPGVERTCYLYGSTYARVLKLHGELESWRMYYDCWLGKARGDRGLPCFRIISA